MLWVAKNPQVVEEDRCPPSPAVCPVLSCWASLSPAETIYLFHPVGNRGGRVLKCRQCLPPKQSH